MLKLENISLRYGKNTVIDRLSHEFASGKVTAIVGESGVGKTSLLNIMAGLLKPTDGSVTKSENRISYIFQEPRLFPWMTALENASAVGDEKTAKEMLAIMGLENAFDKYPSELSGGMKQRVSIARALVYQPDVVLLDEPFKGLDPQRRRSVSQKVFELLEGKTVIMATHDEADLEYADFILQLSTPPQSMLTTFDIHKKNI